MLQQREVGDVLGLSQRRLRRQHRRCNQDDFTACQVVGLGTRPAAVAEQDGAVQIFALEVVTLCVRHIVQFNVRMLALELWQPWNQPFGAKGRQGGEVQGAAAVAAGDQFQRRGFELCQHLPNRRVITHAGRGQGQALPNPLKQQHAGQPFQLADLLADGTLRQVERFTSA